MNDLDFIATPTCFTRLNNDLSGNPRYALNHCYLLTPKENAERRNDLNQCESIREFNMIFERYYLLAIRRANRIDGRKYDTKGYRCALAFTSHSLPELCDHIAYKLYQAHAQHLAAQADAPEPTIIPFSEWKAAVKAQANAALNPPSNS